jgi:hypothetical protein
LTTRYQKKQAALTTKRICKVHVTLATLGRQQRKIRLSQRRKSSRQETFLLLPGQPREYLTMLLTLLCFVLFQAAPSALTPFTIFMGILGLLLSVGAGSFFLRFGTRLAMVERESSETKQKLEKHAAELATANTQVALVAAALEGIKNGLNELKTDVKEWMRNHQQHSNNAD